MLDVRDLSEWMPKSGEAVLCGVSGGLDSMSLLHMLCAWDAGPVIAAHYNHRLRPTAQRDETFVRDWCAGRGVPFVSGGADVNAYAVREGLSVEEAARKLRYDFLRREAAARNIKKIYVAHHAGDNAETILWNLIRGTGLRGLSGMRRERDGVIRPLLSVTRRELEEYAAFYGVPHVEDETNADSGAASRNLLRLEVMPLLRRLNPRAEEHILEAGRRAALLDASMEAEARRRMERVEVRDGSAAIPVADLSDAPPELRPLMLLRLLDRFGVGRKDFGAVHLQSALSLLDGGAGKRVDWPHGVTARISGDWFLLETRRTPLKETVLTPNVPIWRGPYEITLLEVPDGDGFSIRAGKSDRISAGTCPAGARMSLAGSNGPRTLKRLCLDKRISLSERDALPALYVGGRLAAVWRIGVDAEFLSDGGPSRFIRIRVRGDNER